jgi:hypothetical protein
MMALGNYMLQQLMKRLKPGAKIASMGYPDIIAPLDELEKYTEVRSLEYRKDSDKICGRHGLAFRGIPDAHSFFKSLGCELDVYDIVKERGCEILCDLNDSLFGLIPRWMPDGRYDSDCEPRTYDFVLDVGTLEHCFNIGTAIGNMASLLKDGGAILHENPFNWGNHGFYCLQPTFYADFYGQEGFRLVECKLLLKDGRVGDPPLTKRFSYLEAEANSFAIAERTKICAIRWPTQTKYKGLIPDAGERAKEKVNG